MEEESLSNYSFLLKALLRSEKGQGFNFTCVKGVFRVNDGWNCLEAFTYHIRVSASILKFFNQHRKPIKAIKIDKSMSNDVTS